MRNITASRPLKATASVARFCCALIIFGVVSLPTSSDASGRLIAIVSGTYGQNCGAQSGNATHDLASQCNGHETCNFVLDPQISASTGNHCSKNFVAEWQCDSQESHSAVLGPEAGHDSTLVLTCIESTGAGK
ncbi:MAG TPA: hypothetical protein VF534_36475 [Paraburkholderia sp.]